MSSPLPFLQDKAQVGVAVEHRGEAPENHGLMSCADELLRAIEAKDRKGVMMALANAFDLLDSMPHEEGPHEGDE